MTSPRDANLYTFSLNNPVRYRDPDGLDAGGMGCMFSSGACWIDAGRMRNNAMVQTSLAEAAAREKAAATREKTKVSEQRTVVAPGGGCDPEYSICSSDGKTMHPLLFPPGELAALGGRALGAILGIFGRGSHSLLSGILAARGASTASGAAVVGATTKINPNTLHHVFGKASHNLGGLVQAFRGSEEAAYRAVEKAAQFQANAGKIADIFETAVKVGAHTVTVRGRVIDGVVRIGTFFIP
jgi:hypothetical protein